MTEKDERSSLSACRAATTQKHSFFWIKKSNFVLHKIITIERMSMSSSFFQALSIHSKWNQSIPLIAFHVLIDINDPSCILFTSWCINMLHRNLNTLNCLNENFLWSHSKMSWQIWIYFFKDFFVHLFMQNVMQLWFEWKKVFLED